jgi:hypothetical protein
MYSNVNECLVLGAQYWVLCAVDCVLNHELVFTTRVAIAFVRASIVQPFKPQLVAKGFPTVDYIYCA